MRVTVAAVITASLLALGIGPPAGAQDAVPIGFSPSAHGAKVDLLPLDVPRGVRGTWRLAVTFHCKDQEVTGAVVAHVDRAGRFDVTTNGLITQADYGSDTETTIRGRLGSGGARGTIDSYARAYDNDGTTGECERDGIPWRSATTSRPELAHVVGYVPAPAPPSSRRRTMRCSSGTTTASGRVRSGASTPPAARGDGRRRSAPSRT